MFPNWARRLGYYWLALFFVAAAAALRWTAPDVLGPTPFLAFYLAWVGAAAFGGLGPGLLATVASWLCVEVLFDFTPTQAFLGDPTEVGRFMILMAGGVTVSLVAESMRRGRIRERHQRRELADLTQLTSLGHLLIRDDRDRIVYWSEGCARLYGFSAEEAVGRVSHDLLGTEFPQPLETILAKLHETGRWEGEVTHRRADGSVIHVASLWVLRGGAESAVLEVNNDITARKRAEEALRDSEELFRGVFESTSDCVLVWDRQYNYLYANQAAIDHVGTMRDKVIGKNMRDGLGHIPDFMHLWMERVDRALATGESFRVEDAVRVGDRLVYSESQISPIRDAAGRAFAVSVVYRDVTDRRQAEEALRESEDRYRKLFEANLAGVYLTKVDGTIIDFNDALMQMLGYDSREEMFQHKSTDFFADPEFRKLLLDLLRRDGYVPAREAVLLRKDGSLLHALGAGVLLVNEQTGEPYIQGVAIDITERKQAEEALRESELFYRQTLESIPGMVFTTRPDGYCDYQSQQWVDYTGVPMWEHLGNGWNKLLHPEDRPRAFAAWRDAVEGKAPYELEYRVRRHDGRYEWFRVIGRPIRNEAGTIVRWFGVAMNIEAIKQAEAKLQRFNEELEREVQQRTAELLHRARQLQKLTLELSETEDRERKRMAEILHDDLQQQLAAAKFHLGLMRSRARSDASLQATAAQIDHMLMEAIQKSRSLSHELSPAVMHHADFGETLRWLANQVRSKHGLIVRVHTHGEVRPQSDALKGFLYKAAQELLFNIVKHARVNEANIRVRQSGRCICLTVSDRGRGFDPERLRETAGFGLLNIRERIELLGGRMKIRSAPGRGSRFSISLPAEEQIAASLSLDVQTTPLEAVGPHGRNRLRVLLADDHEIVRQGLSSLLSEEYSIEVVGEAANGREAVDLADRLHPDVVIMDVSMPLIDGDEATRQIKSRLPKTRVIALSMYEQSEKMEMMRRAGAECYVLKTAPSEELLAAIHGRTTAA